MSEQPWDVPMIARYTYMQDGDCCGGADTQHLTVETHDGGGGNYLVISTERWAIDPKDIDRFIAMLRAALAGKPGLREFFDEGESEEATP